MHLSKSHHLLIDIITYLFFTHLVTWLFWFLFYHFNLDIFRIIGSFVPSTTALLITWLKMGSTGVSQIIKSLTKWKFSPLYYLFILCYSICSIRLPALLCLLLGYPLPLIDRTSVMGFDLLNPLSLVSLFICIGLIGGPLGEEIGWRGFLLSKFQLLFSPLSSSILVGIAWAFWHFPMFLFHIDGYTLPFYIYLFQTICLSILFT